MRLTEYPDWSGFMAARAPSREALFFFEQDGAQSVYEPSYPDDAYLVFGRETKGLPASITEAYPDRMFHLPMRSPHIRSSEPRQCGHGGGVSGAAETISLDYCHICPFLATILPHRFTAGVGG